MLGGIIRAIADVLEGWGTGISRSDLVRQNERLRKELDDARNRLSCMEDAFERGEICDGCGVPSDGLEPHDSPFGYDWLCPKCGAERTT